MARMTGSLLLARQGGSKKNLELTSRFAVSRAWSILVFMVARGIASCDGDLSHAEDAISRCLTVEAHAHNGGMGVQSLVVLCWFRDNQTQASETCVRKLLPNHPR